MGLKPTTFCLEQPERFELSKCLLGRQVPYRTWRWLHISSANLLLFLCGNWNKEVHICPVQIVYHSKYVFSCHSKSIFFLMDLDGGIPMRRCICSIRKYYIFRQDIRPPFFGACPNARCTFCSGNRYKLTISYLSANFHNIYRVHSPWKARVL